MKKLFMICNSHIDPVWLWQWEEGAAEALSTFRVAAEFCEQFDGFVFNHNEAILYQWVEEYDPELFTRIRTLIEEGRWHIMGGWYLQPDCVMPTGESITRQILRGRQYFFKKFKKIPRTAINFDSFGHSKGLVQILKKAGYDSYIVCRPGDVKKHIKGKDYCWKGFDNSTITVHYSEEFYSTAYGQAAKELEEWLTHNSNTDISLWLWGVGDHGGGPSRKDLTELNEVIQKHSDIKIMHSTPEKYFTELNKINLPIWEKSLTPELFGCYSSQHKTKQNYRKLENRFYFTEKLLSMTALQGLLPYPEKELRLAEKSLLFNQFHDILPGSAIPAVEQDSSDKMARGMDLLSELRMKAVYALSKAFSPVKENESTILVYNPHPYEVNTVLDCEFMLPRQNFENNFMIPEVYHENEIIPSQLGIPESSLAVDWRKKITFQVNLPASSVMRYDCRFHRVRDRIKPHQPPKNQDIYFHGKDIDVVINHRTGLIDSYCRNGISYLCKDSCKVSIYNDGRDSWEYGDIYSQECIGNFELMTTEECSEFCGLPEYSINPVHIVEEGEIYTIVEAVFKYASSKLLLRYKLPKNGGEIALDLQLLWLEKNKIAKLILNTSLEHAQHYGQSMWGTQILDETGREDVSQKWCGVINQNYFLTVINDGTYASSIGKNGELRLPLLRSAGYGTSGKNSDGTPFIQTDHCFVERMDQGKNTFKFWIQGDNRFKRTESIDREAQIHNETPYALSLNPKGDGTQLHNGLLSLNSSCIVLEALKQAEDKNGFILRLRNSLPSVQKCILRYGNTEKVINFGAFEVKTFRIIPEDESISDEELLETFFLRT